jgi:peroxiredoxin Q/BCP
VADNRKFAEKYDFNFSLLSDLDRSVGLAYRATEPGATGGAARVGVLIDPDGRIKDYRPKVSAREYPAEVLALLG